MSKAYVYKSRYPRRVQIRQSGTGWEPLGDGTQRKVETYPSVYADFKNGYFTVNEMTAEAVGMTVDEMKAAIERPAVGFGNDHVLVKAMSFVAPPKPEAEKKEEEKMEQPKVEEQEIEIPPIATGPEVIKGVRTAGRAQKGGKGDK